MLKKIAPILFFALVVIVSQNWWRVAIAVDPIDSSHLQDDSIIVYTTAWCPYCTKLRKFLVRANIPFIEYDVEQSESAFREYERISGKGVPVTTIGDRIIQGYNKEALLNAIEELRPDSTLPSNP